MKPPTLRALLEGDLENAIISETPGGIEAQEAQGQKDFVASETLPIQFNYGSREELENFGVVFDDPVDDLFIKVQLPDGWKKVPTDHSMWSKLLDDQGRERASIFYKAAFYDRSAHINLARRYSYQVEPVDGWDDPNYHDKEWYCVVRDCKEIIWTSTHISREPNDNNEYQDWYKKKDELGKQGETWLHKNYPNWRLVTAYWD